MCSGPFDGVRDAPCHELVTDGQPRSSGFVLRRRGAGAWTSDERLVSPQGIRWLRTSRLSSAASARSTAETPLGTGAYRLGGAVRVDEQRARLAVDDLGPDHHLLDRIEARQIVHGFEQDAFHDRAQAASAGLSLDRLPGDERQRLVLEGQVDALHLEQALVLLDERVLRLLEDALQRHLVEILERRDHRQAADELGDEAEFQEVFGLDEAEHLAGAAVVRRRDRGTEADRGALAAGRDDALQAGKGAAADEQDVRRVDLQELLLRVLAAALRRHRGDRPLHDLEQRLLHALARHVAGDRGVVGLPRDLVDLVDVDDAALGPLDVVVGGLEQLEDDVLDVLADIARLGQRRRVGHRERHVEDAGERLGQERLARARRSDQQDVRLRELDVVVLRRMREALVVVVDRDREHLFGMVLADDVVVEDAADLLRRRHPVAGLHERGFRLLADDVHAQLDAFIADEHRRTGDELADLVLALAAERAVQGALRVVAACLAHGLSPTRGRTLRFADSLILQATGASLRKGSRRQTHGNARDLKAPESRCKHALRPGSIAPLMRKRRSLYAKFKAPAAAGGRLIARAPAA